MRSSQLPEPLAKGRTAVIYPHGSGQVLKLFLPNFPRAEAEMEAANIRAVCAAGVKTPAVHEVVEVNGRYGLVLERLEGVSMLAQLQADLAQAPKFARQLADLHVALHQHMTTDLPKVHD